MSDTHANAGGAPPFGGPDRNQPPVNSQQATTVAAYRLMTLVGTVLGVWVAWTAYQMTLYTPIGPGPGFFPFGASSLLGIFSFILLVRSFLGPASVFEDSILPPRSALAPVLVTVGAVAGFALFVEQIGFAPTTFIMLMVLLLTYGCRLVPALLVALGGSFGVAFVFQQWLGVYLPPAPSGILQFIGM